MQVVFIEWTLKAKNWLLCISYNPNKSLLVNPLNEIQAQFEIFCEKNEDLRIMVDFNANVTAQKMKSLIKDFFSKCAADLATFTEEILNRKLFCAVRVDSENLL